jgi:DNA polymerase I-like protein with 3'-5' exonuclease and polymerase domains
MCYNTSAFEKNGHECGYQQGRFWTGSVCDLIKLTLPKVSLAFEQFADVKKCPFVKSDIRMWNLNPALVFLKDGIMVYEAPDTDVSAVEEILRVCMENVAVLHVPLKINIQIRKCLEE